jgi:chitin disaccharide deacetylase
MSGSPSEKAPQIVSKLLIVNADDLGLSTRVNRGIFESHQHGIVTSASLMVRWPALEEAVAFAKIHPRLGVGLHLDFSEWTIHQSEWKTVYEVVDLNNPTAVQAELHRQIEAFIKSMGRKPTHIDSHQHVHQDSRVWPIVSEQAARLGIPLRHAGQIRYCGEFYGQDELGAPYHQGISVENLLRMIAELKPGITEFACHPGNDPTLSTMYRDERAIEVKALCNPQVRQAITMAGVTLVNFGELPAIS